MALIAIILTQTVQAQIKRQYKDDKIARQTVVVKEESSMSDIEILNSQFDLDDYAVGEQIRITTENLPEQAPETPKVVQEEEILASVDKRPVRAKKPIQKKKTVKAAPKKSTYVQGTYPRKSKAKKKSRRVKKKKRKRLNRNKCYRF